MVVVMKYLTNNSNMGYNNNNYNYMICNMYNNENIN